MTGNIPGRVTFICKPPMTVNNEVVHPAFVSDADNKVTLETGRNWVKERYWAYKDEDKATAKEDYTRLNMPLEGYRIVSLEVRSEGGRAYKIISPEGYYLDLREVVLLDTILNVGISPGGLLNGKYLFGKTGSQMKLVREGSDLHRELIEATGRKNVKKMGLKDLTLGGIYKNVKGETYLFGGFVDTVDIPIISYGRWQTDTYGTPKTLKKAQLWISLPDWKLEKFLDYGTMWASFKEEKLSDGKKNYLDLYSDVIQSKAVVEKVGQVDTMDFIGLVKKSLRQPGYKRNRFPVSEETLQSYEQYDRAYMSKKLNMVPAGTVK